MSGAGTGGHAAAAVGIETVVADGLLGLGPDVLDGGGEFVVEAYYLGTPVCFVAGTSVEEVIGVATYKGAFCLGSRESLFSALDEVLAMTAEEIHECGIKLREGYATQVVTKKMLMAFRSLHPGFRS